MADTSGNSDINDEIESENSNAARSPVRKNTNLKAKGKGRGRGRPRGRGRKTTPRKSVAAAILEDEEEEMAENQTEEIDLGIGLSSEKTFDIDDDISKLETPTFTTLERGPPEPLHQNKKLKWGHKVNLIGEKVVNPMIHCCEKCSFPILIYGRMIPCKHVFCLECAKKCGKSCHRCKDKVNRVEQSALGTVFTCTYGGARHSVGGCKRTYLSQRDLQAHINHRHLRQQSSSTSSLTSGTTTLTTTSSSFPHQATSGNQSTHMVNLRDPRNHLTHPVSDSVQSLVQQSAASQASHTPPPHMQQVHQASSHPLSHMHHISDYRDIPGGGGGVLVVSQDQRAAAMLPPQHHPLPLQQMVPVSAGGAPLIAQTPPSQQRTAHSYQHPSPNTPGHPSTYPSPIPVVSTRSNLITVPIQDDSSSSPHIGVHPGHPPPHVSPYAAHSPQPHQNQPPPPQQGPMSQPGQHPYQQPPPSHHYQSGHPAPPYSQPPPMGQQNFNQPPPNHLPPPPQPMHNPSPPMFSGPPPGHHPPPPNFNSQQIRPHSIPRSLPPPQRFPAPNAYDDPHYGHSPSNWGGGQGPRPPPAHGAMPPRPSMGGPPPHGPGEQGFRPPYYS